MKLKEYLASEERSIAWLARRLRVTRPYLSDMLRGKRPFQQKYIDAIYKICEQKVSRDSIVNDIIGEEDES